MKKIFYSAIIALAGLLATSCVQEHLEAVYDPAKATAQVLEPFQDCVLEEDGDALTASFDKAQLGKGLAVTYTLYADTAAEMETKTKVSATISDGTLSVSQKELNTLILNLGGEAESPFQLYFALFSYMMSDKGTAIESTALMSNVTSATFTPYSANLRDCDKYPVAYLPGGYQAKGDQGASWMFTDEQYLYDYEGNGIYTGLIDFYSVGGAAQDYGFKLTLFPNWDNGDFGDAAGSPTTGDPGTLNLFAKPGQEDDNILCYEANRYYFFTFDPKAQTLVKGVAFDNIGIVGAFNGWDPADANMKMTYNKYYHRFWIDQTFAEATELKFTCNDAWEINWGADFVPGGDNIQVAAGSYRVYFDLNKKSYEFNAKMFGQEEPGGGDVPGPEPVVYKGWGIIGDFNDWASDVAMAEKDGVWTGYVELKADQSWKLRKDAGWDDNRGGAFAALDTPFAVTLNGDNISVGADGFFKVVYDSNAETITVSEGKVWSIIGGFNEWAGDVDMIETDGKWVAQNVELYGEWKLRYNHGWDNNRGGAFEAFGTPFEAVAGGDNINCGEGNFNVVYDPAAETITITSAVKTWGLIGVNGDWENDIVMTEVTDGIWVSPETTMSGEFKLRFDGGWAVNRGGAPLTPGNTVYVAQDGDNITIPDGTYRIVYNANDESVCILGWSVIGQFEDYSWDTDLCMYPMLDGSFWTSPVFKASAGSEIKIRNNMSWDENRGGEFVKYTESFPVTQGGDNIKIAEDGYYVLQYHPEFEIITIYRADWSLIGSFNDWAGDEVMMETTFGVYDAYVEFTDDTEFKLRQNRDWAVNRGGVFVALGEEFPVENNGDNIKLGAGKYHFTYDATKETVLVKTY